MFVDTDRLGRCEIVRLESQHTAVVRHANGRLFRVSGLSLPNPVASCAPDLADFMDPSGALRKAGLLIVNQL